MLNLVSGLFTFTNPSVNYLTTLCVAIGKTPASSDVRACMKIPISNLPRIVSGLGDVTSREDRHVHSFTVLKFSPFSVTHGRQ
jgi:hypothetical protein